MKGDLYVVATPIGNLKDFTYRAKEVLDVVDIIAVEDTRVSKKLLSKYNISTSIIPLHDANENYVSKRLVNKILDGASLAIISDAGTPCISDPGYSLVNLASKKAIKIIPIPGPCSVSAALSISGIPTDHYYFEGFLPKKKGRKTKFKFLESLPVTLVIFESPHRLVKTLNDINTNLGKRIVSICKEMTKVFEEKYTGNIDDAINHFSKSKTKGEYVILVAKKDYKYNIDEE